MPYGVRKSKKETGWQVYNRNSGKVLSRHGTRNKAVRQARMLEGVRHGWNPLGKKR